jgi:hypothetical protein
MQNRITLPEKYDQEIASHLLKRVFVYYFRFNNNVDYFHRLNSYLYVPDKFREFLDIDLTMKC